MVLLNFIKDGGYKNKNLWSLNGWRWVSDNNINLPFYWTYINNEYLIKNNNLGVTSSSNNHKDLLSNFNKFISLRYSERVLISNNCNKLYFEYFELKNNVNKLKLILDSYV